MAYFRSLIAGLCRVFPSNVGAFDVPALCKEIHQYVSQLHGLIVFHNEEGAELETEILCFAVDCPLALIEEMVSGQRLVNPEEPLILLSEEILAGLAPVQLDVLAQVQEESQLKDVLAAANIEFGGGVASSRKARKHRSAIVGEVVDEAQKEIRVHKVECQLVKAPNPFDLISEHCKEATIFESPLTGMPHAEPVATCAAVEPDATTFGSKMAEYEVLLTWMKILGQPEEVLLKKLASFEEYDERMKKLGAKLKESLSPEDLIKTLASIQPTTK